MISFRKHTLYGTVRCVNYRVAYERAGRLMKVFCRMMGDQWDPNSLKRYSVDVYRVFWLREAERCRRASEFCYEDELPADMSTEDRKLWLRHSDRTDDGRRYGPTPETLHVEAPKTMKTHRTHPKFEAANS